jgi:hypothetical protein
MAIDTDLPSPRASAPRIAVVTAVAAGKDDLVDPEVDTSGADFIAFSDGPQDHLRVWQVRPLPIWSSDRRFAGRRHAKLPKVLPQVLLPGYDFYIWIDGNYTPKMAPREICGAVLADPSADIAAFRHRLRTCVYKEAREVLRYRLDHPHLVRQQIAEYRQQGFPADAGLCEMGAFVLRNSPRSLQLSLAWWEQICRYSSRDQLSFPYAVRHAGARVATIDAPGVFSNPCFRRVQHHRYPHAIAPLGQRVARSLRRLVKRAIGWEKWGPRLKASRAVEPVEPPGGASSGTLVDRKDRACQQQVLESHGSRR